MSNLPPGVTESMIPGNTPADIAYEAFWENVSTKADELGLPEDTLFPDEMIDLIDWVAGEAYKKGYAEGRNDEQLRQVMENDE